MNWYEKNSKTLLERFGIKILNNNIDNENYKVEEGRDGKYVVKINKNGVQQYLGSKYGQDRDINNFVDYTKTDDVEKYIVIFGLGFGYHVRELLKNLGQNRILILEADTELLKQAISYEDMTDIFNDERVIFLLYASLDHLNQIFSRYINTRFANSIVASSYHNYANIYSNEVQLGLETIKKFQMNSVVNTNTVYEHADSFLKCYINNLPYIIKGNTINPLKDLFKDKTAVVVSAGPSLSKNMKYLKGYEDKVVIITGGRSLKALLGEGIKPHFACAVDAEEIMYDLMKEVVDVDVPYVVTEQVYDKVISEHNGLNVFIGALFPYVTSSILGKNVNTLAYGGTVASVCLTLAEFLGCNKIIMIGQDLAYTGNKTHAEEASLGSNSSEIKSNQFLVDGNVEEKVLTDETLNTYRRWIEDFALSRERIEVFNCTEGGAKINGTQIGELKNVLETLQVEHKDIYEIIKNSLESEEKTNELKSIDKLKKIREDLIEMKAKSQDGIKFAARVCQHYSSFDYYDQKKKRKIGNVIEKISKINSFIETKIEAKELLNFKIFSYMDEVMRNDEYREKKDDNEQDVGFKFGIRSGRIYAGIVNTTDEIIGMLDELINKFEKLV